MHVPMSDGTAGRITELIGAAQDAMRTGRSADAARLWEQLLSVAPNHPRALFHLGQHALMTKDYPRARERLEQAARAVPGDPAILLNLSFLHRATGDAEAESNSLTAALSIDPYFYPALLGKAMLLDRTGNKRQAARVYKDALSIAPADDQLPPEMRGALRRAREAVEQNAAELESSLRSRLEHSMAQHRGENLARFEECTDVALGRKRISTRNRSCCIIRGSRRSSTTIVTSFRG